MLQSALCRIDNPSRVFNSRHSVIYDRGWAYEVEVLLVASLTGRQDSLLAPLLQTTDERAFQRELSALIASHGTPRITSILQRKVAGFLRSQQELEDVHEEVVLKLILRLHALWTGEGDPIESFEEYVAQMTERAWIDRLRSKHPYRNKLKKRIRYLLTHDSDFVLAADARGKWSCSFSATHPPMIDGAVAPVSGETARGLPSPINLKRAISQLLSESESPFELDGLVSAVWETLGLQEPIRETQAGTPLETIPDPTQSQVSLLEHKEFLGRVWHEVCELPVNQRAALLLNMRDHEGRDLLSLLPVLGVATFSEIAGLLNLQQEKLAALWNDLPLIDSKIAELLMLSRQQVINLRKSARERLSRRLNIRSGEPL